MSIFPVEPDEPVDDDIVEIFVEEAEEVIAEIDAGYRQVLEDPEDKSSLEEIRRAFHTIKGSGRMVKAVEVAELAMSMESMLDRVVDGAASLNDAMLSLIDEMRVAIPALVEAFKNRQAAAMANIDVEGLILQAGALERGEVVPTEKKTLSDEFPEPPVLMTDELETDDSLMTFGSSSMDAINHRIDAISESVETLTAETGRLTKELKTVNTDLASMVSAADIGTLGEKLQSANKDIQELKYFLKASSEKNLKDMDELNQRVASQLHSTVEDMTSSNEQLQLEISRIREEIGANRGAIIRWTLGSAIVCSSVAAAAIYYFLGYMQ
jgi:chemosensory pili system protein ChpA (sensor histidine kinase/response regulator)